MIDGRRWLNGWTSGWHWIQIGGGPSVLYDAVAVLPSEEGAASLMKNGPARDFISDAFVHLKFIAWASLALPLFERPGSAESWTRGVSNSPGAKSAAEFVAACRKIRMWEREPSVNA